MSNVRDQQLRNCKDEKDLVMRSPKILAMELLRLRPVLLQTTSMVMVEKEMEKETEKEMEEEMEEEKEMEEEGDEKERRKKRKKRKRKKSGGSDYDWGEKGIESDVVSLWQTTKHAMKSWCVTISILTSEERSRLVSFFVSHLSRFS